MRQSITTFFSLLAIISSVSAQATTATAAAAAASPDGAIVKFTSDLPACASKCGPLFDVQGKCSPPALAAIDTNCFCTDARLAPFENAGTSGVTLVCGTQSCTAEADLTQVKSWFESFCGSGQVVTTTASDGQIATSTSTPKSSSGSSGSSGNSNTTWIQGHYKWVIMIVIIFVAIVGGWIGACLLRRRYLRKKEREIEMKPPVAWGPHQMQGATGGYNYGDGVVDANREGPNGAGGHAKEFATAQATPTPGKRESRGLKKKNRFAL